MGVGLKHSHFWTGSQVPEGIPILDVTAVVASRGVTALAGDRLLTARVMTKRSTALAGSRSVTAKIGSRTTGKSEQ